MLYHDGAARDAAVERTRDADMTEPLPLSDIRVLEFSHAIMGPSTGMILGDLGADVIKIEPVPDGDRTRRLKNAGTGFFPFYARNKRSLAIDTAAPECRPILEALIRRADVMIENFAVGSMERQGLGYEDVAGINPRIVYCALKGFLSGPYENRRALDEIAQMMSGLAFMTGPAGRPLRAGTSVIDVLGGMSAVIGTLAALREREVTGKGQLVKAGLFEAASFIMGQHMAQAMITGQPLVTMAEPVRAWGIYDIFHGSDGRMVFIGVVTETQWRRFCEVFERPDLLADERLGSNGDRVDHRGWLIPSLAEFFAQFTGAELLEKSEVAELAFGPVNRPEDLIDDPHLNHDGHLVESTLPDGNKVKVPRLPIELGERWFSVRTDPPAISGQASEILAEIGIDAGEARRLAAEGLIVLPEQSTSEAAE
jgi:crotonobetainyl-CoA:carnitine CoA-transferase CaiB-like acyl-CoA transferase